MENKKILLVDDEPELTRIYASKLKEVGYEVITAENGADGLAKTKAEKPDLVLLDMKMPGMNGEEFLLKLQDDPETKNTKVVFLTAFSDPMIPEGDVKVAKEVGAIDLIRKGINLDSFVERVAQYFK